jgi:hypothetical protein
VGTVASKDPRGNDGPGGRRTWVEAHGLERLREKVGLVPGQEASCTARLPTRQICSLRGRWDDCIGSKCIFRG